MAEKERQVRRKRSGSPDGHSKVSMNRLKILVTMVNRAKADFYMDHIQSFGVNMQMVFYGRGTASQEVLTAIGLVDSERAVILSVIGEDKLKAALESIEEKFNTIAGGKGINFFNFLSNNRKAVRRNEK